MKKLSQSHKAIWWLDPKSHKSGQPILCYHLQNKQTNEQQQKTPYTFYNIYFFKLFNNIFYLIINLQEREAAGPQYARVQSDYIWLL